MADLHCRSDRHHASVAERACRNAPGLTCFIPVQLSPLRLGEGAGWNSLRIWSHLSLHASSARHSETELSPSLRTRICFTRDHP
jgi:hypothetical protein